MKPKLILCVGTGWSATTPLYFTFQKNKVATCLNKEPHVLSYLHAPQAFSNMMERKYNMGYLLPEGFRERTKEENAMATIWKAPTLDNYVKFLKHYYNHIKDEYQAVCDFSTTYAGFNIHQIMTFAKTLKENFDVKVIMILRDPFRRMFSHFNHVYRDNPIEELSKAFLYIRRFDKNSFQFPLETRGWHRKNFEAFANSNYHRIHQNWEQFFPTHSIIMEDLWAGRNSELERLNGFLGTNITELHENAYYPDRGADAPHYQNLRDQWDSDTVTLDPKTVERGRRAMHYYYESWESLTGVNPWKDDEWI